MGQPSKGLSFPGIWRAVFLRWAGGFLLARGGFCPSWVVFFCGCGWCLLFGALGCSGAPRGFGLPWAVSVPSGGCLSFGALGLVPTEVFFLFFFLAIRLACVLLPLRAASAHGWFTCQIDCRTRCQIECPIECQNIRQIRCEKECQNDEFVISR